MRGFYSKNYQRNIKCILLWWDLFYDYYNYYRELNKLQFIYISILIQDHMDGVMPVVATTLRVTI